MTSTTTTMNTSTAEIRNHCHTGRPVPRPLRSSMRATMNGSSATGTHLTKWLIWARHEGRPW